MVDEQNAKVKKTDDKAAVQMPFQETNSIT